MASRSRDGGSLIHDHRWTCSHPATEFHLLHAEFASRPCPCVRRVTLLPGRHSLVHSTRPSLKGCGACLSVKGLGVVFWCGENSDRFLCPDEILKGCEAGRQAGPLVTSVPAAQLRFRSRPTWKQIPLKPRLGRSVAQQRVVWHEAFPL